MAGCGATTVFGLIVAVLDSIALALLGIPLAVTWGLLSFTTNYIPNIGFITRGRAAGAARAADRRADADGDRHRGVLRAELHRAVDHPAPLHRRRGRVIGHGDLRPTTSAVYRPGAA